MKIKRPFPFPKKDEQVVAPAEKQPVKLKPGEVSLPPIPVKPKQEKE